MTDKLFWAELQKILRRRLQWLWLAALAGFMCFWVWGGTVAEADIVVDGVRSHGLEAIRKNREIARQWEGTLTLEKLYRILDTYGIAVNETDDRDSPRGGNWVSRYATEELTDYKQKENGGSAAFRDREYLEKFSDQLKQTQPYFCYMEGMNTLFETQFSMNLLLLGILGIALAPVFSEEYQCLTAPVLQTSLGGGQRTVTAKLLAAAVFSESLYLVADGLLLFSFLCIYGTDGLKASAWLCGWAEENGAGLCMGEAYLINFAWGALGILLMCVLTLFFSAKYRRSFVALLGALTCLLGGIALVTVVSRILPFFPFRIVCIAVGMCSPFYLMVTAASSGMGGYAFLSHGLRIALAGGTILWCILQIGRDWNRRDA